MLVFSTSRLAPPNKLRETQSLHRADVFELPLARRRETATQITSIIALAFALLFVLITLANALGLQRWTSFHASKPLLLPVTLWLAYRVVHYAQRHRETIKALSSLGRQGELSAMNATSPQVPIGRNIRRLTLCCSLALAGAATAQDLRIPSDARLRDLASLYAVDTVTSISNVCVQRFPETDKAWSQATKDFRQKNGESVAELDQLKAKVIKALRATPSGAANLDTFAAIVSARTELFAMMGFMLAPMKDTDARRYCDETRTLYASNFLDQAYMKKARTAALAAVEDLGKH